MKQTLQTTQALAEQFSYDRVRATLLFLLATGAFLYVVFVIISTATIAHSKTLVEDIRDHQSEITELNGALSIQNQDLALELQENNTYVTPEHVWYVARSAADQPAFALDR